MSEEVHKSQSDKFKEAARELGADTDEETFDRALAKIAPVKPEGADKDWSAPRDALGVRESPQIVQ